ncbi:fibronectin type III domain-containing protein [Thermoanaerobacterium thermosaccharolyticum]|jgi:acid phosphatase type 7|uniref:fibronectin type III domain-containing protein n=1 Tax=Thermoanaerobacterium thermosaccharolyticum TaxID=1517 RepID=UPI0017838C69|nr:fibronectin type III domain-containing protein [Thermoanaerobacterium thermosaccharolyticum]MBE0069154.1 metallophosphoesterase [Thermoanaerobacterium thermosaccharolyticum]MBE0228977.1 metallophosphoesterase [Thermoanaerobacterium thermosaccharolyticum]
MKKFLSFLTALALGVCIFMSPISIFADSKTTGATNLPDQIRLTWTQDPTTTQTITWRTDTTVNSGQIQYGKDPSLKGAKTINATVQKFSSDLGDMNIHSATLTDLEPGTKYYYRVGYGNNFSSIYSFTTEAKDTNSFKFLIFGDSQSGIATDPQYGPWKTTIQNAFNANKDAKFFINVGDLVEIGQMYAHWNNWFDAAKGVIDTIPEMPVEGNHETYQSSNYNSGKPKDFVNLFPVPQNGPDGLKGQVYSFDYGNAHIVMLDSQEDEEEGVSGDNLESQKAWLDKDLSSTNKTWKIVFFHKTPYYNKATRSNEQLKAAFQPIIDKYHIDVVFNGHDHGYSRTYPIKNDQYVKSPADGTVYIVTGRSGNKYYPDLSKKVWDAFFYDPQDQPNYIVATINGNTLTIKAVKQDGTPIDTYSITKNPDGTETDSPVTVVPTKYNATMLTIYGNMLQQPFMPSNPKQINGKWYVPARAFMQYLGSNVDWNANGTINITYGKTQANIAIGSTTAQLNSKTLSIPDAVVSDSGLTWISADDLKALFGFNYKYNSNTNMLMFVK